MKRLLKFVLILLSIFNSSYFLISQNYEPLIETNKRWNMTRHLFDNQTYTYTARIKKIDTLINGEIYQKVVSDTIHPLTPEQAKGFLGYIREDFTTKKVYYTILDTNVLPFYFEEDEERLLYDFSLELGDTIEVMNTYECPPIEEGFVSLKVVEIDSIQLLDNSKRKRWHLQGLNNGEIVRWIEGIGSEFGLYMSSCPYTAMHWYTYSLLCYYEDDTQLYQEEGENTCSFFWTSNIEEYAQNNSLFKAYPNPNQGEFEVKLKEAKEIKNIEVFGADGKRLTFKSTNSNSSSATIQIKDPTKGVYWIKVTTQNGDYHTTKFVIR